MSIYYYPYFGSLAFDELGFRFDLQSFFFDLFDGRVYNVLTLNATVRRIVEGIRAVVPDVELAFVDSPIMNQLSYEVSAARFGAAGFVPTGNLQRGIGDTIALLRAARV